MNLKEWLDHVPPEISSDSLWRVEAYRLALFISDRAWHDATKLSADRRTLGLSDQLYRAVGSIGANIAEGYSRESGRDRARFYEYALGSARENCDWYFKGRFVLGETVAQHRVSLVTQLIRLLLTMIPQQRRQVLREEQSIYQIFPEGIDQPVLGELLVNIPLPK